MLRPIVADPSTSIVVPVPQVPSYVRCLALCRVLAVELTPRILEWMSKARPEPMEDASYFNPYLLKRVEGFPRPIVAVAPWAIAGYNYIRSINPSVERSLTEIDPAEWYTGLFVAMEEEHGDDMPDEVKRQLEMVDWLYTQDGAENAGDPQAFKDVVNLYELVRLAAASGQLHTDARKIRRMFR